MYNSKFKFNKEETHYVIKNTQVIRITHIKTLLTNLLRMRSVILLSGGALQITTENIQELRQGQN